MLIVGFHGSSRPMDTFQPPSTPRQAPGNIAGIYFATKMAEAAEYGGFVHECRVTLANPYVGKPQELLRSHLGIKVPGFGDSPEAFRAYAEKVNAETVKAHLLALGHDGVVIPASTHYGCDEVIAFDASQVELMQIHQIDLEAQVEPEDYVVSGP